MKLTLYFGLFFILLFGTCQCGPAERFVPSPSLPDREDSSQTPTNPLRNLPSGPAPIHPLEMNDSTSKPWYSPGEIVEIKLSWRNIAHETITVYPIPLTIKIRHPHDDSIIWSYEGGSDERNLEPGEILSQVLTWDQRDNNGRVIEPGYYHVDVEYSAKRESGMVHHGYQPLKILIQSPQGAIEQTFIIEQAQTLDDGSELIFKEIVLSSSGAIVYVNMIPADYTPPKSDEERVFWGPVTSPAHYKLDGGLLKSAENADSSFYDSIELEWDLVDPVSKGTKSLTFVIDSIEYFDSLGKEHEWQGPFEFQIPLK